MIIGIDFDNTIIDYSNVIKKVIKDKKINIKKKNPRKDDLKNYLILNYGEREWTKLQGEIYGKYIKFAKLSNGFLSFLKKLNKQNFQIYIISHKTQFPILGKKINLQNAAKVWCKANLKTKKIKYKIFFANNIDQKIKIIEKEKCNFFIDDLPNILKKINNKVIKIWFSNKKSKFFFSSTNSSKIFKFINNQIKTKYKLEKQGYNNNLYLDKKRNILIKHFKNKNSFKREKFFLERFSKENNSIPKVVYINPINTFLAMTELKGKKIKKVNKNYLDQAIKFIFNLNKNFKNSSRYSIRAVDHCLNYTNHLTITEKYLKKYNEILLSNLNLNTFYFKLKEDFYYQKKKILKNYKFKDQDKKIISPSDFGFRNAIVRNKKIYFFDFEYSGLDGLTKLLLDFANCPEFSLSRTQIIYIIKKFERKYKINISNNFFNLYYLNRIKWTFIILNSIFRNKGNNQAIIKKAKNYYNYRCI